MPVNNAVGNATLRVGLVTDVGKVNDGTFNQYAYEGMVRAAREYHLETTYVETGKEEDLHTNVLKLVEEGCDMVITVGALTGEITEHIAPQHPGVKFVTVDYAPYPLQHNIMSLMFAEDQVSFLAGALAAMMTKSGVVGVVGGMEIPPVVKLRKGFEKGVAHINPKVTVLGEYIDSFTAPQLGSKLADKFIDAGADVIFGAGGQTGSGGILEAAKRGNWVIGVDQDEWVTTFQMGKVEGSDRLLTSAVKQVDNAVYTAVRRLSIGTFRGENVVFDAANRGIKLADFHEAHEAVPNEVRGRLNEIEAALRTGDVKTGISETGEEIVVSTWDKIKVMNWTEIAIPLLAVLSSIIIGGIVIWVTKFYEMQGAGDASVGQMVVESSRFVFAAYKGLFEGALGNPKAITNSLVYSTPYILAGLAVALGFQCGLFNIGAEGQLYMGAMVATIVGFKVTGLPIWIHLPLAVVAGFLGGALWGAIPGVLKATTGAHEVINTIMTNYIAVKIVDWAVKGPLRDPEATLDRTPYVLESARYPLLLKDYGLHLGFIVAIVAIFAVWWFLFKTTMGFEIRTVGANPTAAKYAGMSVAKNYVLAMSLAGGLAALAGVGIVMGRPSEYSLKAAFSSGFGFDSIAVALLAKSHPFGIFPAALLWGALRNGAGLMQVRAPGISIDLVNIIQALVIMFIAADQIVRWTYRLKKRRGAGVVFTKGWGG